MKPTEFLEISKRIVATIPETARKQVLERGLLRKAREETKDAAGLFRVFAAISNDFARAQPELERIPGAAEILKAFRLSFLLQQDFPLTVASLGATADGPPLNIQLHEWWTPWSIFTGCIGPIEEILIPQALKGESHDDLLTLDLAE